MWDRLPIAVGFMALLSSLIAERLDAETGVRLLLPLVLFGAASVLYWRAVGDLRPYLLVQYGGLAAIAALGVCFSSRYNGGGTVAVAVALYGVAKLCELRDREIFALTGDVVSGHTLKHLVAAAALTVILWSLAQRN
jgi:hypothetical protein